MENRPQSGNPILARWGRLTINDRPKAQRKAAIGLSRTESGQGGTISCGTTPTITILRGSSTVLTLPRQTSFRPQIMPPKPNNSRPGCWTCKKRHRKVLPYHLWHDKNPALANVVTSVTSFGHHAVNAPYMAKSAKDLGGNGWRGVITRPRCRRSIGSRGCP